MEETFQLLDDRLEESGLQRVLNLVRGAVNKKDLEIQASRLNMINIRITCSVELVYMVTLGQYLFVLNYIKTLSDLN